MGKASEKRAQRRNSQGSIPKKAKAGPRERPRQVQLQLTIPEVVPPGIEKKNEIERAKSVVNEPLDGGDGPSRSQ